MIFVNRFSLSTLFHGAVFSVIPNCRNLFIHLNNNLFGSPRTIHIVNFSEVGSLLHQFSEVRDLNHVKSLHSAFIKTGLDQDVFVRNNIIQFYMNCYDLIKARRVFDEMLEPNLVSWTTMISSYIRHGDNDLGLQLFSLMCCSGLQPNEFGFSVALKACRISDNLVMGKLLHGQIIKLGFELSIFCSTSILGVYAKSGNMDDARRFFNGIPLWGRSEALWNTLLDSYVQTLDAAEAVELFHQMLHSYILPNCFTYMILTNLCAKILNFNLGRSFHCRVIKVGFENHGFVGGSLVDTYAKLGSMDDASKVFRNLDERDNVVWSALLAGFHQKGDAEQGLNLYLEFVSQGYKLDPFSFATAFNLCSSLETLEIGSQVHCSFVRSGFVLDSFVGSALIDMYSSAGMVSDAYKVFLEVRDKNEICFSAMINSFVFDSDDSKSLELFTEMRKIGLIPCDSTLSCILRTCGNLHMLEEGRAIHSHIMKTRGDSYSNFCTGNALIEMYAKCGRIDEANIVFKEEEMPDEFSWTTIISSYIESERYEEALELFREMLISSTFVKPSQFTLVVLLQACARLSAQDQGKQIHGYIIKAGFEFHAFVGSALISMYSTNTRNICDASRVFSYMTKRDLVSWSTIITALAQHRHGEEALKHFSEFRNASFTSTDESILSSCLSACASLAALEMGKWVHACIVKAGFESHLHVGSSIIDMYCKCGSIRDAYKFFSGMRTHNEISWTAMICGYAHHGLGKEALSLFDDMKEAGLEPDGVTFIGVLTACSHVGLVKEGWQYFESMRSEYRMDATINHYACMVDLLGRAGQVEEAEALIRSVPLQSKTQLWRTLLGACNKHGNIQVGNRIADILIELEPCEPSTYVSLSNLYASASLWGPSIGARNKMKEENVNKKPGFSWIQVES